MHRYSRTCLSQPKPKTNLLGSFIKVGSTVQSTCTFSRTLRGLECVTFCKKSNGIADSIIMLFYIQFQWERTNLVNLMWFSENILILVTFQHPLENRR